MSLKAFLSSRTFWKNMIVAVGITIILLFITMFVLRIYTGHGRSVPVPDIKGLCQDTLSEVLDEYHLFYEVRDSVFVKDSIPGSVIDQYPKPGAEVKRNRKVWITICAVSPEQVEMPKLTDISFRQAINVLESVGLVAGTIEYIPSEFLDLVLEQKMNGEPIAEGTAVLKGSQIDLVLGSDAPDQKTYVPELIGKTIQEAKLSLGDDYLNMGAVVYDDSFSTEEEKTEAKVWKQAPEHSSEKQIEQGTSVDIWVTTNPEKLKQAEESIK